MKLELSRLNYPCREESLLNITNVVFSEEDANRVLEFELVVGEKELIATQILVTSFNKEEEKIKETTVEATNSLTPKKRIKYTLKLDKNTEFGNITVSKLITKEFENFDGYFAISFATKERISLVVESFLSGNSQTLGKNTQSKKEGASDQKPVKTQKVPKEKVKEEPEKVTDEREFKKKRKALIVLLIIMGVMSVIIITLGLIVGLTNG